MECLALQTPGWSILHKTELPIGVTHSKQKAPKLDGTYRASVNITYNSNIGSRGLSEYDADRFSSRSNATSAELSMIMFFPNMLA